MIGGPLRIWIAVLDDYQNVALSMADWSVLRTRATVTVFNDHLTDAETSTRWCRSFARHIPRRIPALDPSPRPGHLYVTDIDI